MSQTRSTIARTINQHPGIHFSGLVRHLDLAPGQVQYHLKRLHRNESIIEEYLYGQTHYYRPGYDTWERHAFALLRRETTGDIVAYLLTNGPASPGTIATDLDIARSTLSWHIDRLVEQDLISKHYREPNHLFLCLERPESTVRLLRQVDPSLGEQLVGRFTRLIDRLLE